MHDPAPLAVNATLRMRSRVMDVHERVFQVEDVKKWFNTTHTPVHNSRTSSDDHLVIIQVVFDCSLVQRRTDVIEPHLKVEDEAFQNLSELANFINPDFGQKWEKAKVPVLDFPQFASQKLAKRPEKFPKMGTNEYFSWKIVLISPRTSRM